MTQATELKLKAKSKLLEGLNVEQKKAVTHRDGPLLIVAGAGTGKTTVITRRIAYLIEQGVKPEQILALAFGEKAAGEMEERLDLLLPTGGYYNLQISTFHAFAEQILHEYGLEIGLPDFKVLDEVGQWLLIRNNLDKFDLQYYRPIGNPTKFIKAMLAHFSRLKDELVSPEEYLGYAEKIELNSSATETRTPHLASPTRGEEKENSVSPPGGEGGAEELKRLQEVAGAFHTYQKLLLDNSALDFGDLINYTLDLCKKRPRVLERLRSRFQYILVDEFQDTNLAQYGLMKLLAAPHNNITVVGDDDQSIYKFRGASISNILHFQRDYPQAKFISLTINYRSTQKILDSAYQFIQANNPDRLEVRLKLSKKLNSQTQERGEIVHLDAQTYLEEAETVVSKIVELKSAPSPQPSPARGEAENSWNDFVILARSHATLDPFLNKLDALQIPYIYFANKGLYNKPIIIDLLSYFRLLDNYHENTALFRVLKFAHFKIASRAIIELGALAKRKSWSLFQAIKQVATLDLDEDSLAGIRELLALLEKHSEFAKRKSMGEIYVLVINDLHFSSQIRSDSLTGLQNARYLEIFYRRIQDFQNESPDKSLKIFMNMIGLELEAGEEGDLQFDPEAGPEAIKLMTVHAAKGLEFKYVFVVGLVDKRFPTMERREQIEIPTELIKEILPEGEVHLEEERRLFYVAMTRAKSGLYLTSATDYGGKRAKKPSRFLVELGFAKESSKLPTGKVELKSPPSLTLPTGGREIKSLLPLPKYFSFSQISLFRRCPLEYKYRYLMHLPVPGSGNMSFGITIHTTFEKYLKVYTQQLGAPDLFGSVNANPLLPAFNVLEKYYAQSWIDEWYESREQLEQYRKLGHRMLKDFYEECVARRPKPKYLEKSFKLKLGNYYFMGKLDRADESDQGLVIIDYKTGEPRPIEKVEKDQLLVYQWAASDLLGEQVGDLQYWFLQDRLEKRSFIGENKDIEKVKTDFLETIGEIVSCTKTNGFLRADQQTPHKNKCKFMELEL